MLSRHRALPLVAAAFVVITIAVIVWSQSGSTPIAPAAEQPHWQSPQPSPTSSPTTTAPAPRWQLGEFVATTAVNDLEVFDAPGGTVTMTLDEFSEATFQPLTLLGLEERESEGARWLHVLLPVQPNQSSGWIRADDVTLTSTTINVHIYVAERTLEVWDGDELVFTAPVAVGTDETPTPPGVYSVTDPLDSTHNDTGVYGAYALGLSGFSEVLETFNGAPPQLAIHGTNQPELIGQPVSNGCVRMLNPDVLKVVERADLGTPVLIHASRANLTTDLSAD